MIFSVNEMPFYGYLLIASRFLSQYELFHMFKHYNCYIFISVFPCNITKMFETIGEWDKKSIGVLDANGSCKVLKV